MHLKNKSFTANIEHDQVTLRVSLLCFASTNCVPISVSVETKRSFVSTQHLNFILQRPVCTVQGTAQPLCSLWLDYKVFCDVSSKYETFLGMLSRIVQAKQKHFVDSECDVITLLAALWFYGKPSISIVAVLSAFTIDAFFNRKYWLKN